MPSREPPRIELSGLSRTFVSHGQEIPVLRGIDLTIEPGEAVAVAGPSGSGKSTLLSILALIDPEFQGVYRFDGADVHGAEESVREAWRLGRLGVAFQDLWLVESLSSLENVMVPLLAGGVDEPDAEGRARDLLREAGVAHRAGTRPALLSGGERRRVAFARALSNRPSLLLLDEPTAELDDASAEAILGMVRRAHQEGATIVCASHDERLLALCRRRLTMMDGRLQEAGAG